MDSNSNMELKASDCEVTVKNPTRILHFSDGTLEEYSESEEPEQMIKSEDVVDTASMGWGSWMIYKAACTGSTTLAAIDYVGEALASFLGITTPKYQYELDEYIRIQRKRKAEADGSSGWLNPKLDIEGNNEEAVIVTGPGIAEENVGVVNK